MEFVIMHMKIISALMSIDVARGDQTFFYNFF